MPLYESRRMTPLDKPLKRALKIRGRDYVLTASPQSLKLTEKGHRLGMELQWVDLISGESALAVALRASVGRFDADRPAAPPTESRATRKPPAAAQAARRSKTTATGAARRRR